MLLHRQSPVQHDSQKFEFVDKWYGAVIYAYVALCSGQLHLGGVLLAASRFAQTKFVVRLASRLEHIVFTAQVR